MFPLRDENPTRTFPAVTLLLIAANVVVFLAQLGVDIQRSVLEFGLIPAELLQGADRAYALQVQGGGESLIRNYEPAWATLFSSMFMHGGLLHIAGNMWFLWIFGNNVEDAMGRIKFPLFYVTAGLAAAGAQILTNPDSPRPMVGASGAIGGVLGAYLVLFPGSRIITLITAFVLTTVELPAVVVLGFWFVIQIASGLVDSASGGVAYAAHVGGFVAGLILGRLLAEVHPASHRRGGSDFADLR
jgi:membrane associated rhomboid family serine protease